MCKFGSFRIFVIDPPIQFPSNFAHSCIVMRYMYEPNLRENGEELHVVERSFKGLLIFKGLYKHCRNENKKGRKGAGVSCADDASYEDDIKGPRDREKLRGMNGDKL